MASSIGVVPFLAACHACVLMLYCIAAIVCYVCSFEWQIKFSLSHRLLRIFLIFVAEFIYSKAVSCTIFIRSKEVISRYPSTNSVLRGKTVEPYFISTID